MEEKSKILKAYQAGKLDAAQQAQLEAWIAEGSLDLEELALFPETLQYLEQPEQLMPSARMDELFQATLAQQKNQVQSNKSLSTSISEWLQVFQRWAMPITAAILLFLGGRYWEMNKAPIAPDRDVEHIASTLINTEDVSEKIHLVSSTKIIDETDKKIIDALLFTLSNDRSNNVRLACIDVLMNYSYLPIVRTGLISSISHQNSPVVLANLAEAIAAGGEKMDKQDIHSRIDQALPPPVKKSMEAALINL